MVNLRTPHTDATTVISWAVALHDAAVSMTTPAPVLLERWFADAAARWPTAWRASRRSPRAMLWLAARSAALASFNQDARERCDERTALRAKESGAPEATAQLLAVGDVLRELGVVPPAADDPLPDALLPAQRRAA